jgi:hypothetical protein
MLDRWHRSASVVDRRLMPADRCRRRCCCCCCCALLIQLSLQVALTMRATMLDNLFHVFLVVENIWFTCVANDTSLVISPLICHFPEDESKRNNRSRRVRSIFFFLKKKLQY